MTLIILYRYNESDLINTATGQVFSSSLSFDAMGKTSAPGQLSIDDLRNAENYLEVK
ncbi:type I 3-dehydroquinate dehydratase [Lactobacillus sp.]|uniref:type I 3-dehydroquinate dehydratase n=1 Tax=Lactobacillus sp. TaxID=1591 RepID=UPI00345EAF7A